MKRSNSPNRSQTSFRLTGGLSSTKDRSIGKSKCIPLMRRFGKGPALVLLAIIFLCVLDVEPPVSVENDAYLLAASAPVVEVLNETSPHLLRKESLEARKEKFGNYNIQDKPEESTHTLPLDSQTRFGRNQEESNGQIELDTAGRQSLATNTTKKPIVIAHAISFLRCGPALTSKYKDAMLVLRHSIHKNSVHVGKSKYDYKMYAFVNSDNEQKCPRYRDWIQRMGYTALLLPNPVNITEIRNSHFRKTIDKTGVAGSSELIKLYLYTLTDHPVVVHWDIDVIVLQPMDDLFDSIIYDAASKEGQEARSRLKLQQPLHQKLPDTIDAFFTRDIALARPWENRQVAQGGFLVARPSMDAFESYLSVIREANFSARCGDTGGWGNMGYGCKQGAMHYQGVVAYFYDNIQPGKGHGVELDVCVWNQVAHSVIYQGNKEGWYGTCRQSPIYGGEISSNRPEHGACHDCRILPIEETMTAHFTACSKPWQCRYTDQSPIKAVNATTNATTCGLLVREFYKIRQDLESELVKSVGESMTSRRYTDEVAFHPEYFLGYCGGKGKTQYVGMPTFPEDFEMRQLYGF